MSRGTTRRTVRVDDALWDAAKEKVAHNNEDLSEVIRASLRAYIEQQDA